MYRQHFGLKAAPLDKAPCELWDDGALARLEERFLWLLQSPGIGLLTGEPGVGKTAALRRLASVLNPHRYQVIYLADQSAGSGLGTVTARRVKYREVFHQTDFGRTDLYRGLALALGLEPAYRRAQLWRDLKARILEQVDGKNLLPVWILDEAQNLPAEFFKDLPAFLNFAFDSRDLMTVWLVGHPVLAHVLDRAPYAALAGRIQVRIQLKPVVERERFAQLIQHALKTAGCPHALLAESGLELLRLASQGLPRQAGRILRAALQRAVPKGLNHLPDDLLQETIEELR
jgi:type II secretory pathway predicted ATPase ExeA